MWDFHYKDGKKNGEFNHYYGNGKLECVRYYKYDNDITEKILKLKEIIK